MNQKQISKLSTAGAESLLTELMHKLSVDKDMWGRKHWRKELGFFIDEDENAVYNLSELVECLDNYGDEGDEFGTEGWRHRYDF
jgi:hypothetical protein